MTQNASKHIALAENALVDATAYIKSNEDTYEDVVTTLTLIYQRATVEALLAIAASLQMGGNDND